MGVMGAVSASAAFPEMASPMSALLLGARLSCSMHARRVCWKAQTAPSRCELQAFGAIFRAHSRCPSFVMHGHGRVMLAGPSVLKTASMCHDLHAFAGRRADCQCSLCEIYCEGAHFSFGAELLRRTPELVRQARTTMCCCS